MGYRLARPADLEETVRQAAAHGVQALPLLGDVTRAADASAMVAAAATRFGGLDILVNNAGVIVAGPFETVTEAQWDRLMAVNVKGVFLCLQAAVPHLREQERARSSTSRPSRERRAAPSPRRTPRPSSR